MLNSYLSGSFIKSGVQIPYGLSLIPSHPWQEGNHDPRCDSLVIS